MSVLTTESFIRYQRRPPGLATAAINDDLTAGGYSVVSFVRQYNSINNAGDYSDPVYLFNTRSPRLEVTSDPVYASRNAIVPWFETDTYLKSDYPRAVALSYQFDTVASHWILGARVNTSLSNDAAIDNPDNHCGVAIGPAGMDKSALTSETLEAALGSQRWMNAVALDIPRGEILTAVSGTPEVGPLTVEKDRDYYLEVEIDTDANLIRAWLDDLLVIDTAFEAADLATAKAAYEQGFCLFFYGVAINNNEARFMNGATRDVYCVSVDNVAPFQRLGPTTQVIGELPDTDAQAQFIRPVGYASNAEVAALPVVPNPGAYLSADNVGQEDRYTVTGSDIPSLASIVHAVGIKSTLANFSASPHNMGAVIKSGPTAGDIDMGSISPGSGFTTYQAYFAANPDTSAAWSPTDAAASEFGIKVLT